MVWFGAMSPIVGCGGAGTGRDGACRACRRSRGAVWARWECVWSPTGGEAGAPCCATVVQGARRGLATSRACLAPFPAARQWSAGQWCVAAGEAPTCWPARAAWCWAGSGRRATESRAALQPGDRVSAAGSQPGPDGMLGGQQSAAERSPPPRGDALGSGSTASGSRRPQQTARREQWRRPPLGRPPPRTAAIRSS